MFATLRQSMTWLHTWAGVAVGSVLMVIFFMGTLSVFDREIDRWMMPSTRLELPAAPVSIDRLRPAIERLAAGSPQWSVQLPDAREPAIRVGFRDATGEFKTRYLHPHSGQPLPEVGTLGGREFFFPFHYRLHIKFLDLGYWIVGFAAMAMLVLLVSGIIIHVRIFQDFFTFRPQKRLQRSSLDLHTLTGVLALPFHFLIPLSGLIIFFSIYLPAGIQVAYQGNRNAFFDDAFEMYKRPKAGHPGELASLDAMVIEARTRWGSGEPNFVRVSQRGDANAYVEIRRQMNDRIRMDAETIYFDGATGAVLKHEALKPAMAVQRFISGLHFILFDHWPLRWLYFLLGLSGCIMIGTGFVFWIGKRRDRHARDGQIGARLVAALACTSITGLLMATLAILIANRLLPAAIANRAQWEVAMFFATWIASGAHAWLYAAKHAAAEAPWRQHCWAICALAITAPVLNWITTGDHPLNTLLNGNLAVAGVDGVLFFTAVLAAWAARKLKRQQPSVQMQSNPIIHRKETSHA